MYHALIAVLFLSFGVYFTQRFCACSCQKLFFNCLRHRNIGISMLKRCRWFISMIISQTMTSNGIIDIIGRKKTRRVCCISETNGKSLGYVYCFAASSIADRSLMHCPNAIKSTAMLIRDRLQCTHSIFPLKVLMYLPNSVFFFFLCASQLITSNTVSWHIFFFLVWPYGNSSMSI